MRNYLITIAAIPVAIVTIFFVFFNVAWWEHTINVREMVQTSVDAFENEDIDWNQPVLLDDVNQTIVAGNKIFTIGAIRDEYYEYREVVYRIGGHLNLTPTGNRDQFQQLIELAKQKQAAFYAAHKRFQNNLLFAMWHTF